jgi:hypothetical protein
MGIGWCCWGLMNKVYVFLLRLLCMFECVVRLEDILVQLLVHLLDVLGFL